MPTPSLLVRSIGDEGAAALGEGLKFNAVLTKLNLQLNVGLGEEVKQAVKDAVSGREGFQLEL